MEAAWDAVNQQAQREAGSREAGARRPAAPGSGGAPAVEQVTAGDAELFRRAWGLLEELPDADELTAALSEAFATRDPADAAEACTRLWALVRAVATVSRAAASRARFQATRNAVEATAVALLGHWLPRPRNQSVKMLNVLYDGHEWEARRALRPSAACVGDEFAVSATVELPPELEATSEVTYRLLVCGPSTLVPSGLPNEALGAVGDNVRDNVITAHAASAAVDRRSGLVKLESSLGSFRLPGFWDWRFVALDNDGSPVPLKLFVDEQADVVEGRRRLPQGRIVVYRAGVRSERFREVVVDLEGVEVNYREGKIERRGTFKDVRQQLPSYAADGVTSLCLIGALERDNGWAEVDADSAIDAGSGSSSGVLRSVLPDRVAPTDCSALVAPGWESDEDSVAAATGRLEGTTTSQAVVATRPDVSPHAVICRRTPNRMLGGARQFSRLVSAAAAEGGIRVLVQCDASVSATRAHRRYRGLYAHMLDSKGERVVHRGTDGRRNQWEDLALLNYRRLDAWNVLIDDVAALQRSYGVSGVFLVDCQSWPLIMTLDQDEMFRRDADGEQHYSANEILHGEVVQPNEEAGFWQSKPAATYANPLLAKLARSMWLRDPKFILVGESHWGREGAILRSGVLPNAQSLISSLAAAKRVRLSKEGRVQRDTSQEPPLAQLNRLLEFESKRLPSGGQALVLRSLCSSRLPYPALLLGRGAWTAVDVATCLPGVSWTFGGETRGLSYRPDLTNTYTHQSVSKQFIADKSRTPSARLSSRARVFHRSSSDPDLALGGAVGGGGRPSVGLSGNRLMRGSSISSVSGQMGRRVGSTSSFPDDFGVDVVDVGDVSIDEPARGALYRNAYDWHAGVGGLVTGPGDAAGLGDEEDDDEAGIEEDTGPTLARLESVSADAEDGIPHVNSWASFGDGPVGIMGLNPAERIGDMAALEARHKASVGPEFGFDLAFIGKHYEHRARIRELYPVLRDGELIPLRARHRFGEHNEVFAFARVLPDAVAVVAANFNQSTSAFWVDCSPLAKSMAAHTVGGVETAARILVDRFMERAWSTRAAPTRLARSRSVGVTLSSDASPAIDAELQLGDLMGQTWQVSDVFDAIHGVRVVSADEAVYGSFVHKLPPHRSACFMFTRASASAKVLASVGAGADVSDVTHALFTSSLRFLVELLRLPGLVTESSDPRELAPGSLPFSPADDVSDKEKAKNASTNLVFAILKDALTRHIVAEQARTAAAASPPDGGLRRASSHAPPSGGQGASATASAGGAGGGAAKGSKSPMPTPPAPPAEALPAAPLGSPALGAGATAPSDEEAAVARESPLRAALFLLSREWGLDVDVTGELVLRSGLSDAFGVGNVDAERAAACVRSSIMLLCRTQHISGVQILSFIKVLAHLNSSAEDRLVAAFCRAIIKCNRVGPIVFVAPEMDPWSTMGGLAVMVKDLAVGLAGMGAEVICISPFYHRDKKGRVDYLRKDGINYTGRNIHVRAGSETLELGVHKGRLSCVDFYFIHEERVFPKPYPALHGREQLRQLVVFAKASLEVLCQFRVMPSVIVTNDWFTGLVPAYARVGTFGSTFAGTTFMHIVHNLDIDYEGRIFPNIDEGSLDSLHGLPRDLLVNPYWRRLCLQPTRTALLACQTWGTVSRSYRRELLEGSLDHSPLQDVLALAPEPFAHPNGIPVIARREKLAKLATNTHETAKAMLQRKYFGFEHPDMSVALFGFVGRITKQKGVHLILEAAQELITRTSGRCAFIVGGMASESDTYGQHCARLMREMAARHPSRFWADPSAFFTDGPNVNIGADFSLMPSEFEPGGIVQQEFFVAGTPVIAHKTGGLRDTVHEFNTDTLTGNGFTFEAFNVGDYMWAVMRALRVFANPAQYARLRANAEASVVDLSVVCRAWNDEFHRLRKCITDATVMHFSWSVGNMGATPASSVVVTGLNGDWTTNYPLAWNRRKFEFELEMELAPGTHTFKYRIDGKWATNPQWPTANDPTTGATNNVVIIAADPEP